MKLFDTTSLPKSPNTISLGGEMIEVKPLTLENSLRLVLLVSPFIASIERHWPELQRTLETTNGTRPGLLQTIFIKLHNELAFAPGVITQALGLLVDKPVEWVAANARAEDLIRAWPTLDQINDFRSLFLACKSLGITVKYG